MSFNRSYKKPASADSQSSSSTTPSFLLPKTSSAQATVSLNDDNLSAKVIHSSGSPDNLINYLEHLDVSSTGKKSPGSNAPPTLNSILNLDNNKSKKERELISAMTYDEGTALDESSSDDSDGESEAENDNKQDEIEEKKLAIKDKGVETELNLIDQVDESESNNKEDSFLESVVDENHKIEEQLQSKKEPEAEPIPSSSADIPAETFHEEKKEQSPQPETKSEVAKVVKPKDTTNEPNRSRKGSDFPTQDLDTKQNVFDFQKFLKQFKSKQCEPVHKYLKSFIIQFSQKNWSVKDQVKLIKDFEVFIFGKLITYPPFDVMDTEVELANCREGLEKLIISRLYNQIFPPVIPERKLTDSHREDLLQDKKFYKNLRMHEWIDLPHLDIPIALNISSTFIKLASVELAKINTYKSPRDKIICILNCCKVIFGLIRQQQKQHKIEENADSFVPLLIYVILQSRPKHLPSNLSFIERYRNDEFLIGEVSYYVSTLQIATNFISTIDKSSLTIDEEDYNRNMKNARDKLEKELQEKRVQRQKQLDEQREQQQLNSPIPKKLTELITNATAQTSNGEPPSQVLKNSAELLQQSIQSSFSSFFSSPSEENSPASQKHKSRSTAEQDLLDVKKLSIEDHDREVSQRKERDETIEALIQMFPTLDRELVSDVVMTTKGGTIGDYVDACLELCT